MTTRHCMGCGQDKTIRGVWYLKAAEEASAFYCEACYGAARAPSRVLPPRPEGPEVGRFDAPLRL